ncbi:MAG: S41 family peptidase [Clostridia bacterium]|nr:S41 family peptidase [Clostridia bacterium]
MKTSKRISVVVYVVSILLAILVTLMTTYVVLSEHFTAELRSAYLDANGIPADGSGVLADTDTGDKLSVLDQLYSAYYYNDMDPAMINEYILRGFVAGTGDRYGDYFTPEEFEMLTADNSGEMQGIGVSVIHNAEYGVIEVISVMPDSPALAAGVEPGDLIVAVGEEKESVVDLGYTMAVNKMQGKAGTQAVFTVQRGPNYTETVEFSITRGYVTEVTVLSHICATDPTVGIIKITGFDLRTPEQFIDAIETLRGEGATRLVFDVRYNPGGDLTSITDILDYLLPAGPIIRMVDKAGNSDEISSDAAELVMPMAVLANESTASAAELFTAALKDYQKAVFVGTTTYGKGNMQSIIPLNDGSALKLTTRMYFPPFSESYEGIGIVPDLEVEMDEALANKNIYKITDQEDTQLQAAIKWLDENTK